MSDLKPPMYHLTPVANRESILRDGLRGPVYLMPGMPYGGDLSVMDDDEDLWEVQPHGELTHDPFSEDWEEWTQQPAMVHAESIPPHQVRLIQ